MDKHLNLSLLPSHVRASIGHATIIRCKLADRMAQMDIPHTAVALLPLAESADRQMTPLIAVGPPLAESPQLPFNAKPGRQCAYGAFKIHSVLCLTSPCPTLLNLQLGKDYS